MERIDWSLALETDEPTPRKVTLIQAPANGTCGTVSINGVQQSVSRSGKLLFVGNVHLRNVRALRTGDECLQRMEALVRRMADKPATAFAVELDDRKEAREIVKLLPAPPVDPDLIEARKIVADLQDEPNYTSGKHDDMLCIKMTLAGVKRGRELVVSERYEADSTPGGTRDLVLMLIERETPGGPHRYRCDQNVRELAKSIARTLGMHP